MTAIERDDPAWIHPMCNHCWLRIKGPTLPVRADPIEQERCCFCDRMTDSGIYVRMAPRIVHGE